MYKFFQLEFFSFVNDLVSGKITIRLMQSPNLLKNSVLGKGSEVSTLLLYLHKAFNTSNHNIILKKWSNWIFRNVREMVQKPSLRSPPVRKPQISPVRKRENTLRIATGYKIWSTSFLSHNNDLPNVCFSTEALLSADDTSINGLQCPDLEIAKDVTRLL